MMNYLEPPNDVKKQPFHKNSLFQEMDPKTAREAAFGSGCWKKAKTGFVKVFSSGIFASMIFCMFLNLETRKL